MGNSNATHQCTGRQCFFDWAIIGEEDAASRGCAINRANNSSLLNMTITNNLVESNEIRRFEFYCEFKGCNSLELYRALLDVIDQWYRTINPMLRILGLIKDTTTTMSTRPVKSTSTTSQSQRTGPTSPRTVSSSTKHPDRSTSITITGAHRSTSAAIPTTRSWSITTITTVTSTPSSHQSTNPTRTLQPPLRSKRVNIPMVRPRTSQPPSSPIQAIGAIVRRRTSQPPHHPFRPLEQ